MGDLNLFPLYLSLRVAFTATLLSMIIGLPIAYYLSKSKGKIVDFIDTLVTLPVVLPPTVLGYYLLVLLGRQSFIGQFLERKFNIMIVFTPTGAIIAAMIVSIPFMIKTTRAAFLDINPDILNAARVLGRTEINIFFKIMIPISWRGIVSGIALSFSRSLGDFGTTLMVAGNIPYRTTTMPIAIYDALISGNRELANLLVLIMTLISITVLFIINRLEKKIIKGRL
ncbi:molybdenum ABC transporter permease subunit [Vulcanibacillus modesticaldus]|uniref:Molybdenum transport system permease n=1 Tax=Vulcanibacillus modesticaldus TaxID=337097 RepID=A0A1D2YWV2_9BACI|nr:molybdate ABC transporter permease subunit [Vulcanibacillus modesticaldus]OEG00241.1 molybdenum ABC transporter permease subunit [Vulcanibacillus modesticaldus]